MSTRRSEQQPWGERIDRVTAALALLQLVAPARPGEGAAGGASVTVLPARRSDPTPCAAVA